jgi:uncharacterized protein YpiB (UPF0302 family)
MSDIHYKTNLTFAQQVELMKYAKSICQTWIYEELHSVRREPVEKDFDEALAIFEEHKTHFCVIFRGVMKHHQYLEVSMSDFKQPCSFLWIYLDPSHIPEFCKDFPARNANAN